MDGYVLCSQTGKRYPTTLFHRADRKTSRKAKPAVEQIAMRGKQRSRRQPAFVLCRFQSPGIAALLGARSMLGMRSLTTKARAFSAKGRHSASCDPPML
jgi:hypothetical protein